MAKTASGLVEFATKALNENWAYVYATYGQMITQKVIDACASRYPTRYKKITFDPKVGDYVPYKTITERNGLGKRGADCIGLKKGYLWWRGDDTNPTYVLEQDKSADMEYSTAISMGLKSGTIETIPLDVKGLAVRFDGHVGIYIGDGWVIEARGVNYGVVKTRLSDRKWTHWYYFPWIDYEEAVEPTRTLYKGLSGNDVKWLQIKLNEIGNYSLVVDGKFGGATDTAVRDFQQKYGLVVDGRVGGATRAMLKNPVLPWSNPFPRPSNTASFSLGSRGTGVLWIQTVLKRAGYELAVDGSYGPITARTVRLFQSKNNLAVDGIVGNKTLLKLDLYNK